MVILSRELVDGEDGRGIAVQVVDERWKLAREEDLRSMLMECEYMYIFLPNQRSALIYVTCLPTVVPAKDERALIGSQYSASSEIHTVETKLRNRLTSVRDVAGDTYG